MGKELISFEEIEKRIYSISGTKVMLDSDLAELYGVKTKVLNQAVTRNKERFPSNFMFILSSKEQANLKSQIVTSSSEKGADQTSWGGRRTAPKAFTEHGILMLANVIRSQKAIDISIQIIEAFVRLRKVGLSFADFALRLEAIEKRLENHDEAFELFNNIILPLLEFPEPKKRKIGFRPDKNKK